MKQVLLTVALFVSSGIGAYSVTPEDNIVIIDGAESYEFVVSDKGIVVKTVQTHEFAVSILILMPKGKEPVQNSAAHLPIPLSLQR